MPRYRIPHGAWAVVPFTGIAVFQSTGTSIVATWTGEDLVLDTDGPVRVRDASVTGPWVAEAVRPEPIDQPAPTNNPSDSEYECPQCAQANCGLFGCALGGCDNEDCDCPPREV